jgi:hypothetical protein
MAFSMNTACTRTSVLGRTTEFKSRSTLPAASRKSVVVRAQQEETSRRAALGLFAAGAALVTRADPSQAAYGEAANVFGKATNQAGFVPYSGEGYALLLPSKWNPSKERDFPGTQLRYEDNGDAVTHLLVAINKTDKSSISGYGSPQDFLKANSFLLGEQTFFGKTISEGGFKPGSISSAALLDVQEASDKKGKPYYKFEILTRTADGNEGGRHQLITAAVSGGNLYVLKVQVGDKRWFKGADRDAKGAWNSFTVA